MRRRCRYSRSKAPTGRGEAVEATIERMRYITPSGDAAPLPARSLRGGVLLRCPASHGTDPLGVISGLDPLALNPLALTFGLNPLALTQWP
jgi:hypothetical protein